MLGDHEFNGIPGARAPRRASRKTWSGRLAADGEPPILSADRLCNGQVSVVWDYLDGHPVAVGVWDNLMAVFASLRTDVQFVYELVIHVPECSCEHGILID